MSGDEAYSEESAALAAQLGQLLLDAGTTITTAESCTGGLIAAAVTEIPGSSAWFEQGLVTYANDAKHALLGVPRTVLEQHGAVSEACVLAMVAGARKQAGSGLAVAVSGVAGPDGGSADKPVGTVWLAWATYDHLDAQLFHFSGDRRGVREQAVLAALRGTIFRFQHSGKNQT